MFLDIDRDALEGYVQIRLSERGIRGGTVSPITVTKELNTFSLLWGFAKQKGYACRENPSATIRKPRANQKPPFMTWEQIIARIGRGGLTQLEVAELWDSLFLREPEISEFLKHIRDHSHSFSRCRYLYPAVSFCAYTGARRSEMFRALVDDVDGSVLIREKKRQRDTRITFREVPLHPQLDEILKQWLAIHPGGQFLFCKNNQNQLEDKTSRDALKSLTRNSKWQVLRGFHVLRHSFASNLARHGVDQRKIDDLMGHQTAEMAQRYRHLFPEDKESAVSVLRYDC